MNDSILNSIKDAAGVIADDTEYDSELILHINTAFMILRQIGVGPETPFSIEDDTSAWSEFTEDNSILPMVKSFISLNVRKLFDPPTSSSLATALDNAIAEYTWRLNTEVDHGL